MSGEHWRNITLRLHLLGNIIILQHTRLTSRHIHLQLSAMIRFQYLDILKGSVCKRHDLTTTHEGADTIIIQQKARVEADTVLVIADDTYIFILLLHFCHLGNVLMVSPIQGRAVLDINASAEKHRAVLPDLLVGHCLSCCDTVASHFGIGKVIALKVMRSATHRMDLLGNTGDQVQLSNMVEYKHHNLC